LAKCGCTSCNHHFWATFPIGHAHSQTLAITQDRKTHDISHNKLEKWLSPIVQEALYTPVTRETPIDRKIYQEHNRVIILNCLDYLYGHVLLKLFNAQYHLDQQPEYGLILIIPKSFEWLVPEGVAEVWSIDMKLSEGKKYNAYLDEFIQSQMARFDEVYLSFAYSHTDLTRVDFERFTGIAAFDMENYQILPPTITFITREDRLWFGSSNLQFLDKALRKLKLKGLAKNFFVRAQNAKIRRASKYIKQHFPEARIFVAGLGKTGKFPAFIKDKRATHINTEIELEWCKIYAQSHFTVGVHGSNMLIPTALSGGAIEILPYERYGNIVQDLFVRYTDRRQLFMYRFTHPYVHPKEVGMHAVGMLSHYEAFKRHMVDDSYTYSDSQMHTYR